MPVPLELKQPLAGEGTAHEPRFYRPELDAVRFFAFFSVFLFHASNFATRFTTAQEALGYSGKFGVCLFFVLSSYLIAELLIRERDQTGTVHIGSFYMRRILRIWPLYFGFIALCIVIGLCMQSGACPAGQSSRFHS